MYNTIKCKNCGTKIEISDALTHQIEEEILANLKAEHKKDLEEVRKSAEKIAFEKVSREIELKFKDKENEAEEFKKQNHEQINQILELNKSIRELKATDEKRELESQKKLETDKEKIREEESKKADEKQRLNLAARDKTIGDLQKALDDAQRKASQGSQQLQGEILELDFETTLADSFRDDDIEPVAKGVRGGDIRHTVKNPRGTVCGIILWEIKRTKNWVDGWIPKLKEDLRNEKANIPIIITEVMPKPIAEDIGTLNGVWICKPNMAVVLASLLRKSLLDAGLQKVLAENRGNKAEELYNFVTSHKFIQQIEAMVETYQEMTVQITKERTYYTKFWAEREAQAQRLLLGTANIIGSMQGHVGHASMPKIKGLELLDSSEEKIK